MDAGRLGRRDDLLIRRCGVAVPDVVHDRVIEQDRVLRAQKSWPVAGTRWVNLKELAWEEMPRIHALQGVECSTKPHT